MSPPTLARVIVEIGFTAPTTGSYLHLDDTVRGLLDTATLAPDDLWTDVTQYVVSTYSRRGATRDDGPLLRFEGGTATIVLRNEDRRFDPTNLAGPYVVSGVTQVEPMRAIRIRATWNGITYPIWQGFTDEWAVSYDGPRVATATVTCVDAFAIFASFDRDASVAVGSGEGSGARINRILDSIGWPALDRVIATGQTLLQATTLADNALTELLLTSDTELGELYVDNQGRVTFRARRELLTDTRSNTPQGVFGGGPGELPYADVTIAYDRDSIRNLISIARVGGSAQVVEDAASRDAYLTKTHQRHDLVMTTDQTASDYANYLLHQTALPELRFSAMTVKPQRAPDTLYPHALGRELGDRITVIRRPATGDPIERDVFVRGIEHTTTTETWQTDWVFQSASRLSFLTLDNATLGQLDINALAY